MNDENNIIQTSAALQEYTMISELSVGSIPQESPMPKKNSGIADLSPELDSPIPIKSAEFPGQLQPINPSGKGITDLNELQHLEVLRSEFASSLLKPKVILSYETICKRQIKERPRKASRMW